MPNTDHQDDSRQHNRERERVETSAAAQQAAAEVEALHVFLQQWFRGALEDTDDVFSAGFVRRFDPAFVMINPSGQLVPLAQVTRRIRAAHGSSPAIEIEVRQTTLRRELSGVLVVTYEEWQRNAAFAERAENVRISTALLQAERVAPGGWAWLHLHECWLALTESRSST